jgi:hypothetical protein
MRRLWLALLAAGLGLGLWAGSAAPARAQAATYNVGRFFYYPYYFWPANYWPVMLPPWPEQPGAPYMRPPPYMAYPPFREPQWRYDWYEPLRWHRGFHFWLDQF